MKVFVILLVIIIAITFVPQSFSACIYDEKTGDFVEPCSGLPTDRIIIKDSAGNQITPVLNKEVFFHYNVQNYGNQSQTYDLDISVNNDDTNLPIFHKKIQLVLEPDESKPIVWSFTPTNYGNYSAKITKNEITLGNSFSIEAYPKSEKSGMNFSEFQEFCKETEDMNRDLMPIEQRLLVNLCDLGLSEKHWNWIGSDLDWKNFVQNVANEYAQEIPLFVEKGFEDSLIVNTSISGRDSFPPPMFAYISFYYDEDNKTKRFGEKYIVNIFGEFTKYKDHRLPPLKLFNIGYHLDEIQCKQNLVLLQKYDGSPACVTEPTKQKLIERGWTKTTPVSVNQPETAYNGPTDIPSANNQFAMNFYSQVSQENTDNVFFSPASIFTAFAIAYEGAGSNTAKEMQDVFGFEPDHSARHERFADMQQRLNFEGQNNTLSIANALWLANHFEPYDDYVRNVENYYSGKVESVDFASKEKSLDIINQWIHDNTNGKIEKIFETLSPDTKLAITNAIYFKGMWEEPFDKDKTVMAPFHVRDGTTVSVPMMELDTAYLNQTKTPAARILELPYEGNKISMLILLPNEIGRIHSLEDSLSAENIRAWQEDYTEIKTKAYVPKFKLETDYDLIPPLVDLGVSDAFGNADFSGISELDLFIYKAVHKAFVEVNEEGTEAAAATGIAMMESGPAEFRADHPFVFIIQDNETGQILFMGRVMDPTQ